MTMKRILILGLVLILSGCQHIYGDRGVIKNHDTDFLKAQDAPPLKMPPGVSDSNIESHYPVARKTYGSGNKNVTLTPPELNTQNTASQ